MSRTDPLRIQRHAKKKTVGGDSGSRKEAHLEREKEGFGQYTAGRKRINAKKRTPPHWGSESQRGVGGGKRLAFEDIRKVIRVGEP